MSERPPSSGLVEEPDGATPPAEPPDGEQGADPRRWTARARTLAPWIVAVVAVAVAAVSLVQWQLALAAERERTAVAAAAEDFIDELTNWDANDGMTATREALHDAGTEGFAEEVAELFGTTEDLRALEELGARSEGEIRRIHVQSIEDDRALALVVVSQRVTAATVDGEDVSDRYAELVLLHADDRWLVDEVELLVDATDQDGQTVTSGSSEPAPEEGS